MRQYKAVGGEDINVFFTAMKINERTNKMFDIMHNSFGEGFAQTGRQLTQHFYLTMFNTMSRSIEETKHKTLSKVI
jgi:hypothetical protein